VVELMQPCDCGRAVSLCEGRERGLELDSRAEARSHAAKWIISVPDRSAASSRARCNGSASSGTAASRPYMRPSQSSNGVSWRSTARRRRLRRQGRAGGAHAVPASAAAGG